MTNLDNSINPSDISVTVKTEYLANQSIPDENQFAFAYHITITNNSNYGVVLMHRHWIIIDANDQRQEVKVLA